MRTHLALLTWLVLHAGCGAQALEGAGHADLGADGLHVDPSASCPRRDDQPAQASVRIVIENHAAVARFVSLPSPTSSFTVGPNCAGFSVRSQGAAEPLHIERGVWFVCEGAAPMSPAANRYRRVEPGASFELALWDGRALVDCSYQIDCATRGWQPGRMALEHVPHAEPQPAGTYEVSVAYEDEAPARCKTTDGIEYGRSSFAGPTTREIGLGLDLCPAQRTASASATLGTSGETTVTIAID